MLNYIFVSKNYLSKFWIGKQRHENKFGQKIIMYELPLLAKKSNAISAYFI